MLVVIMDSNFMKKSTEGLLEKASLFSRIEHYEDIDRMFPPRTHPFLSTNKKIFPNMKNAVLRSCNQTTRC
jgi:hypothetical protein